MSSDGGGESSAYTFIVHIWKEWTGSKGGEHEWRGHVKDVSDGEQKYFRGLEGMVTAVKKLLSRDPED